MKILRYMSQDLKNVSSDYSHLNSSFFNTLFTFLKSFKLPVTQTCLTILVIFVYKCNVVPVV